MIYTINKKKCGCYKLSLFGKNFVVSTCCYAFPTTEDFQDVINIAKERGWIR